MYQQNFRGELKIKSEISIVESLKSGIQIRQIWTILDLGWGSNLRGIVLDLESEFQRAVFGFGFKEPECNQCFTNSVCICYEWVDSRYHLFLEFGNWYSFIRLMQTPANALILSNNNCCLLFSVNSLIMIIERYWKSAENFCLHYVSVPFCYQFTIFVFHPFWDWLRFKLLLLYLNLI